jgi:hypothetical protein
MDSKTASKLEGEAPQSEREKRPDGRDFTNIPTEDPRAALKFCQSLARMLAASSNPAINNTRQLQIVGGIKAAPSTPEHQPELSVFIPVFNEEGNITVLHSRLTAVLEDTHTDYEIIFVDDGSNDVSLKQPVPTSAFQVGRSCPLPKTVNTRKLLNRRQLPKSLLISRPARYPSRAACMRKRFELIAKVITFRVFTSIGSWR